jgi:hypothetical protein
VLLAACSGGDKIVAPDSSTGPSNTRLSTADSIYMASTLANASFDAINNLRRIPTRHCRRCSTNQPPCNPSIVVGGTDSNNNRIPDNRSAQYTAAGCTYTSSGATVTVSGGARLEDLGGITGYRATYTSFTVTATKGDSVVRTVIDGTFEYRWTSANSATTLDNSTLTAEVRSSAGSVSLTRTANPTQRPAGSTIRQLHLPLGHFHSGRFTSAPRRPRAIRCNREPSRLNSLCRRRRSSRWFGVQQRGSGARVR